MALRDVWALAKKVDSLLALEAFHHKSIDELKQSIAALDRRVARLEDRESVVVTEAKAAARSASYEASQGTVMDLARRIGALEAQAAVPAKSNPGTSKAVGRKKPT